MDVVQHNFLGKEGFEVKEIPAKDTYPIRHAELRKGRPFEDCAFKGDMDQSTIHIGGFHGNSLISVATLLKLGSEAIKIRHAYQLRGMAVLEKYQGKGIGKILLTFGESLVKHKGATGIWMNARITALDFYRNSGYKTIGEVFEVPGIGPHHVMFKKL
ncbi:MAG: GNAT family N-acetyltransferase [Bacteroidota bacterium]